LKKIVILLLLGIFIIGVCTSIKSSRNPLQEDFVNVLDIRNIPKNSKDDACFFFSDKGAWFGFSLPDTGLEYLTGAFPGPFLIEGRRWLGTACAQLVFYKQDGSFIPANDLQTFYLPGKLRQSFQIDGAMVVSELIFISDKIALIRTAIENKTGREIFLYPGLRGNFFMPGTDVKKIHNGVKVNIPDYEESLYINFSEKGIVNKRDGEYEIKSGNPIVLKKGERRELSLTLTLTDKEGWEKQSNAAEDALKEPSRYISRNRDVWEKYLERTLYSGKTWSGEEKYKKVAVKSLITLMVNYRAPRKDLLHGGFFPSVMINYFDGFWAWDSWKHSAAFARIDGKMAEDQIRAMFDYQTKKGMIPDVIYADKRLNNHRDSKPPLAAWAVWRVFEETKDKSFLKETYPALVSYHEWWYNFRDHDKNGLCEYGSTDGTLVAARWESGMDDAVRFDNTKMMRNSATSWSMNQESICLNSFLCAEKKYLSLIAREIGMKKENLRWKQEADELSEKIQNLMFDKESGFFYDISVEDKSFIKVMGSEGWTPVWASVATNKQASSIKSIMEDSSKFQTYVPLPTVASDEPEFMTGYWRGPVWLDQVYFGVSGLRKYGYKTFADSILNAVINNCQGLCQNGTIRENYDPRNGKGLKVHYFSWSAASILLMYWAL